MSLHPNIDRIIIHLDYDCFYASVIENQNPLLKGKPLAIQQKQIIVTCNYEARKRGLHKLQLIKDAKKVCPDVIIVLGEDLTLFRNASRENYNFLQSYSWNGKVERLGLDEVFLDVSDIIQYNVEVLPSTLDGFFHLDKHDPIKGFPYNASQLVGNSVPPSNQDSACLVNAQDILDLRLRLASHLASHIRQQLEQERGYTCTSGISTSKLLSKLVGNLNKPSAQTTLLPPYSSLHASSDVPHTEVSNVTRFINTLEVGRIPGIGFKTATKLREYVLQRPPDNKDWTVPNSDAVLVQDVLAVKDVNAASLQRLLSGPGVPHGTGPLIWNLLHGVDNSPVSEARDLPKQISIEDSYPSINTFERAVDEMRKLATSLIKRMRIDLLDRPPSRTPDTGPTTSTSVTRWLGRPKTLRLSTRSRIVHADGERVAYPSRISRTSPVPAFLFNVSESVDTLANKLVNESLVPLFRRLHPANEGWSLSLINIAIVGIESTANEGRGAVGRDIGGMFRTHDERLREWTAYDDELAREHQDKQPHETEFYREDSGRVDVPISPDEGLTLKGSEDEVPWSTQKSQVSEDWVEDDASLFDEYSRCLHCGASMPSFAMAAHERFHDNEDR